MIQHPKCTTNWKTSGTVAKTAMGLLSKQHYRVKYDLGREVALTMCFSETFLLGHWKIYERPEVANFSVFVEL
jgi:hypothetical protein